jgi:hypothetical protein
MSLITKYAFGGACKATELGDDLVISGPCYDCKRPQTVTVRKDALEKFRAGAHAQNCFSKLSAEEREFLISGICGECWDLMFSEDEDDTNDGENSDL